MARSKREIKQALDSLDAEAQQQQQQVAELRRLIVEPTDTSTRHTVAIFFVVAYFVILFILFVGIPLYNLAAFKVTNSENTLFIPLGDTVQIYSAIVGPALGFVIGYYFKTRNDG
jgi:hypothetical protein